MRNTELTTHTSAWHDTASSSSLQNALRVAVVTETYPPEINGVAMTVARLVNGLRAKQIPSIRLKMVLKPFSPVVCRYRATPNCTWVCQLTVL
jgi:hypothetical protein